LLLTTTEWNPAIARQYLYFSWNIDDIRIAAGEVVAVKPRLLVPINTIGVTNFGFNINFIGREYPPGDTNKDYTISILDIVFIGWRVGTKPLDSLWDPIADVNCDNRVDILDVVEATRNFAKTFQF
jgi:hypothetical protein